MGAWGSEFLENDVALDFVEIWDSYISPLIRDKIWNNNKAWFFLRDVYFKNRFNVLDSVQNSELLALAVLFDNNGLKKPDEFRAILEKVINSELRQCTLDEWSDPSLRKQPLIKLLQKENLRRIVLSKGELSDLTVQDEIDELAPFIKKIKQMIKTVKNSQTGNDLDSFEKYYPSFFNEIEKILIEKIPKPILYTEQEMNLIKMRFMLLAFYVGWKSPRCSSEELLKFIQHAEMTQGYFIINIEAFNDV